MAPLIDFAFTQANLQDYVECRRRFQLRHLLQLAWPALEAEPAGEHELHMGQGEMFHRLIHQHRLGIPVAALPDDEDGPLARWWQAYQAAPPANLPEIQYPEISLSAPLGGQRLVAKLDLVAVAPGRRAVIVDWKTSARRPTRSWLMGRLQTRVYRYVLAQAGAHLNGDAGPWRPEQISMLYWFANEPEQPELLPYDEAQLASDGRHLLGLAQAIAAAGEDDFPKTDDVRRCRFCPYRSLCDRGAEAGSLHDADAEDVDEPRDAFDWDAGFDFEQIAEIAF